MNVFDRFDDYEIDPTKKLFLCHYRRPVSALAVTLIYRFPGCLRFKNHFRIILVPA